MKSCPTCNRTYPDDTLAFCLMDGSVLSAPYDAESAKPLPTRRETSPPRTEILTSDSQAPELPPTRVATSPRDSQQTITTPPPDRAQFERDARSQGATPKSSGVSKVLIAVAAVAVLGAVALGILLAVQFSSKQRKPQVDIDIRSPNEPQSPNTTPESNSPSPIASVSVSGRWLGNYTNSKGHGGKSTITITELADGTLVGDEDGWRIMNGRRNGNSLNWEYLKQDNGCRDYKVLMELSNDGTLSGTYQVVDRCPSPSTYGGRYINYKRQ